MVEGCAPIGDPCGGPIDRRIGQLDSEMSILKAQVQGYYTRLCNLEAKALVNIDFGTGGRVTLTTANGAVSILTSPYLVQLLNQLAAATSDTSKIVGGELTLGGDLSLVRANGDTITLGNIVDIVNPARAIEIRTDGKIEVTLEDGATKFSSVRTVQSAVTFPTGPGAGFGLSLLTSPVTFATGITGQTGAVNIAGLSGVTIPVGTTHVLIACAIQHNVVNTNASERAVNYSTGLVNTKEVSFAGRRNVNGAEPLTGNYDINSTNTGYQWIVLPNDNTMNWVVNTYIGAATNPTADTHRLVTANFIVHGFAINAGIQ